MHKILKCGSIVIFSSSGYTQFFPNFKYWRSTRGKGEYSKFYEFYFRDFDQAVNVINELDNINCL